MTGAQLHLDPSHGEVQIHTGVEGRAAKMGHKLAIGMTQWRATVWLHDGEPTAVELTVDVGSLQVLRSEGGLKPLSGQETKLIRRNALKSLRADKYPQIRFHADSVDKIENGGYRLTGSLEIFGTRLARIVEVRNDDLGDAWQLSGQADVRQTDFGIKPYSLLAGSLKVADSVTVTVSVMRVKEV